MPSTYVFARNGMGDYTTGTGMREDMLMQIFNMFLVENGVLLSGDYQTTETSTPSMAVTVAAGRCMVLNSSYTVNTANSTRFWGVLAEEHELAISSNVSGSTRYDIVVVQINTVASANDYGTNVATVEIVEGTPGAGVPSTPSNALKICEIEVANAAVSITNSDITDSRLFLKIDGDYIDAIDSSIVQPDWQDWTPNEAGHSTMTFTSTTVSAARYKTDGNTCHFYIFVTGTTGGTASPRLVIDSPIDFDFPTVAGDIGGACFIIDPSFQVDGVQSYSGIWRFDAAGEIHIFNSKAANWGLGSGRGFRLEGFFEI